MLTLWVSQSQKSAAQPTKDESKSNSEKSSQPSSEATKTMTYRGKAYTVETKEEIPHKNPSNKKTNTPKRMYRGKAY